MPSQNSERQIGNHALNVNSQVGHQSVKNLNKLRTNTEMSYLAAAADLAQKRVDGSSLSHMLHLSNGLVIRQAANKPVNCRSKTNSNVIRDRMGLGLARPNNAAPNPSALQSHE